MASRAAAANSSATRHTAQMTTHAHDRSQVLFDP